MHPSEPDLWPDTQPSHGTKRQRQRTGTGTGARGDRSDDSGTDSDRDQDQDQDEEEGNAKDEDEDEDEDAAESSRKQHRVSTASSSAPFSRSRYAGDEIRMLSADDIAEMVKMKCTGLLQRDIAAKFGMTSGRTMGGPRSPHTVFTMDGRRHSVALSLTFLLLSHQVTAS